MADDPLLGIPSILQGPAGPHRGHRHEHRRAPVDDPARRHGDARPGGVPQQPAAEGRDRRHQLGPPRPGGDGRHLDAAARHRADRRQPAGAVRHRQEDRQAGRRGGDAAAGRLRPDDLPAPGQAVRRHPDQRRLHDAWRCRRPAGTGACAVVVISGPGVPQGRPARSLYGAAGPARRVGSVDKSPAPPHPWPAEGGRPTSDRLAFPGSTGAHDVCTSS